MKLKLKRMSVKPFVLIMAFINLVAGFIIGVIVAIVSLAAPEGQGVGGVGAWAILVYPLINGLLGVVTGAFIAGLYNFMAAHFGGFEFDFEALDQS